MEQLNKQEQNPIEEKELSVEKLKNIQSEVLDLLKDLKEGGVDLSQAEVDNIEKTQSKLAESMDLDLHALSFVAKELAVAGKELSSENLIKAYADHFEKVNKEEPKTFLSMIRKQKVAQKIVKMIGFTSIVLSSFTAKAGDKAEDYERTDFNNLNQTEAMYEGGDDGSEDETTYNLAENEGTSPEMLSANLDLDLVFEVDRPEAPTEHVNETINEFLNSEDLTKILEKLDIESKINLKIISAASPEITNNWDEDSAREFIEENKLDVSDQEIENITSRIAKGEVPDGQEGNTWLSFLRGKFLQSSLINSLENLANNGNENAAKLLSSVAEINIENHVTEETDFDENTGLYKGKIAELQGKTLPEVRAALNGVSFEVENTTPFVPEVPEANLAGLSFSEKGLSNINELFSSYSTENGESENYDATILNNQDQVSNLIKKSLADYIDGKIQEEIKNGNNKELDKLRDIRADFLEGKLSKDLRQFINEAELSTNFIVAGSENSGDLVTNTLENNFQKADGDISKAFETIKSNPDGKYNIVSYDRVVADMELMKELSATDTDFTLLIRNPGSGQAEGFKISSSDLYEYMQDAEEAGKLRMGTGNEGQRLAMVGSVDLDNIKTWLLSNSK